MVEMMVRELERLDLFEDVLRRRLAEWAEIYGCLVEVEITLVDKREAIVREIKIREGQDV